MAHHTEYGILPRETLNQILENIKQVRVGIIGDCCLDIYWDADMTKSELSRETPHFPLPVVGERLSPGGASNVAANAAALGAKSVSMLGVVGEDWRGNALIKTMKSCGIQVESVIVSKKAFTNAYIKPMRRGISSVIYEDPRIDFNNYEQLDVMSENELLEALRKASQEIDVLCVSDQLRYGCITDRIRAEILNLAKDGLLVIADSRDRINCYSEGVILKPNEVEGMRAVYGGKDVSNAAWEDYLEAAKILGQKANTKVCMTFGKKGNAFYDGQKVIHIPVYDIQGEKDFVGAGDTFLSALSTALGTGALGADAAAFANYASCITIKKIGTTGTASQTEILDMYDRHMKEMS